MKSELTGSYVLRHTKRYKDGIEAHNLYQYREPMSPHLAAQLAPDLVSWLPSLQGLNLICDK